MRKDQSPMQPPRTHSGRLPRAVRSEIRRLAWWKAQAAPFPGRRRAYEQIRDELEARAYEGDSIYA